MKTDQELMDQVAACIESTMNSGDTSTIFLKESQTGRSAVIAIIRTDFDIQENISTDNMN